jgi:hypothetical protein
LSPVRLLTLACLVALGSTIANAAVIDDPPLALVRSTSTLAKVRALYERTRSREHARAGTVIEEWRLAEDHLTGTHRVRRSGNDVRETIALGPFLFELGVRGGVFWQQNRNGLTYTYGGFHQIRDEVSARAWETAENDRYVRLAGESPAYNAYVVEINPPTGRHEWRFIDKATGYVTRTESVLKRRRYVTTFDDYRTFDGIPEPSHVRSVDSNGNERDETLLSRTLDLTGDPHELEIPANRRTLVEFPSGTPFVRLPIRVINGLLIIKVAIGSHSYDFLLDSGAAGIVVDPAIVDDGKLDRYGARVGSTIGTYNETASIIPQMQIAGLRLRSVVVRVVNVPFVVDEHTRIAGLLGFDFFADCVVHIDIARGVADVIAPATFRVPAEAVTVPLALDDRTPDVRARIGGVSGRVVLDTGANRSVFTTTFAGRADVATEGAGNTRFRAMGGTGTAAAVHIKQFELAGIEQTDPLVDVTSADFGTEDVDGTAGTDLLHPYELYFDYRANALYARRTRAAG